MAEIPDDVVVTQEDDQRFIELVRSYPSLGEFEYILKRTFAAHRIAAEQKAKAHWLEEAAKVAEAKVGDNKHIVSALTEQLAGGFVDVSEAETLARYEALAEEGYRIATAIRSLGEQE